MGKKFKFNFVRDFMGKEKEDAFEFDTHFSPVKKIKFRTGFVKKPKKSYSGGGMKFRTFKAREYQESKQLCIFKTNFKRSKDLNRKHLEYIKREGTGAA